MKKIYNIKIEYLVRVRVTHITKENFFLIFKKIFNATITELNIKKNFKKVNLVLINF